MSRSSSDRCVSKSAQTASNPFCHEIDGPDALPARLGGVEGTKTRLGYIRTGIGRIAVELPDGYGEDWNLTVSVWNN